MAGLSTVQQFVELADAADDMAALRTLIEDATAELGFDYFAIAHHIRYGRPTQDRVRLSNYPIEWLAWMRESDRVHDPVMRAAERGASGFAWEKLGALIHLSDQERDHLDRAAQFGMIRGYTVPNHIPGEAFGSCNFAVRRDSDFPETSIPAAQALGSFAFEAARRLIRDNAEPSQNYVRPAPLNDRQRDCLIQVARGKSDSVIGQLLNIDAKTVNYHLERAKRRYSVATRQQLVVRALFQSDIIFAEVLD